MTIIVDAYNLLKYLVKSNYALETEIKNFIRHMEAYSKQKRHTIILVFDGFSKNFLEYECKNNTEIIFTGHQSADDYIKKLISSHKQNIILVSSDRELCTFADNNDVPTIDSDAFALLMKEKEKSDFFPNKSKVNIYKFTGNKTSAELDKLMIEGSRTLMYKNEIDNTKNKKSLNSKLSKEDKKLLKISRKL